MKVNLERKRSGLSLRTWVVLLGGMVLLAAAVTACDELPVTSTETTVAPEATVLEPTTTTATSESTTTTAPAPTTTTTVVSVSEASKAYAASIGGTDHYGETLWFIIGASVGTEAHAKELLEPAKAVHEMQMYYIVQRSDNFDGMRPGYWIVVEAHSDRPTEEEMWLPRIPFPDAYVKTATVMTHDPIPIAP